jgi:L-ribulokinase
MTRLGQARFRPDPRRRRVYNRLYEEYRKLHDGFGGVRKRTDLSRVMKALLDIRAESLG